jgi:hypothetical protein
MSEVPLYGPMVGPRRRSFSYERGNPLEIRVWGSGRSVGVGRVKSLEFRVKGLGVRV